MKHALIYAALLAVAAPAMAEVAFEPTRHEDSWVMTVHEFESRGRLASYCESIGAQIAPRGEAGCAVFDPNTKTCTINVLSLQNSEDRDQMNVWGHELAHCKYGRYHSTPQ